MVTNTRDSLQKVGWGGRQGGSSFWGQDLWVHQAVGGPASGLPLLRPQGGVLDRTPQAGAVPQCQPVRLLGLVEAGGGEGLEAQERQ